ncbi:MAG: protein translocase subunit SecD, partial [Candidatus Melainabacteria bacterium]|nr:protein translocase subunit SecD [Candidatus Melainabacteria bacterium]
KGFAVTLAIGVLVSMFSAIFVTKTLLSLSTKIGFFRNPVLFGVKL